MYAWYVISSIHIPEDKSQVKVFDRQTEWRKDFEMNTYEYLLAFTKQGHTNICKWFYKHQLNINPLKLPLLIYQIEG